MSLSVVVMTTYYLTAFMSLVLGAGSIKYTELRVHGRSSHFEIQPCQSAGGVDVLNRRRPRQCANVGLLLVQRLRRWPNTKPALAGHLFSVLSLPPAEPHPCRYITQLPKHGIRTVVKAKLLSM